MIFNFLFKEDVEHAVKFCIYEENIPEEIDKLEVYSLECSLVDLAAWIESGKMKIKIGRMGGMNNG